MEIMHAAAASVNTPLHKSSPTNELIISCSLPACQLECTILGCQWSSCLLLPLGLTRTNKHDEWQSNGLTPEEKKMGTRAKNIDGTISTLSAK
jgi:hypothetical protein